MRLGFPGQSFARLAAREDRNYWFRARNRLIVWALRRHFPGLRDYLEVGCGTGYVLSAVEAAFPSAMTVGGEAQRAGLEQAVRRVRRSRVLQIDATSIPFHGALLERVLDFERGLIRCGLRFPFGGSLLVVAKKADVDSVQ